MTSGLGIAATTAILKRIIETGLAGANLGGLVGDITVSALPPDRVGDDKSQLNLFMYQVTPNPGWRNHDLASRSANGDRLASPPLAIDLHYLLTAYGAEDLQAEILLGYGMQFLHEMPVLTREGIREVFKPPRSPMMEQLFNAGLQDQPELVKLTPQSMSSDEMSKLWAVFGEKYRPTAAFMAAVVLIQSQAAGRSAPPVLDPQLDVVPFAHMSIDDVEPALFTPGAGATLALTGSGLGGRGVEAKFGNGDIRPPVAGADSQGGRRFVVEPSNDLPAGVNVVRITRPALPDDPASHVEFESNAVAFVVRPLIGRDPANPAAYDIGKSNVVSTGTKVAANITVRLEPAVTKQQRVQLLLNRINNPIAHVPEAYTFAAPSRQNDPNDTAVHVRFPVAGVEAGTYVVRVRVDGADSPLTPGPAGWDQPSVTLP